MTYFSWRLGGHSRLLAQVATGGAVWRSRVLAEAVHPDLSDAVTVHPICQEELYNPGRDVSINPNENSILTPQRPVPDVRLGFTSTRRFPRRRESLSVRLFPFREVTPTSGKTPITSRLM